jgi:hypothetical protein
VVPFGVIFNIPAIKTMKLAVADKPRQNACSDKSCEGAFRRDDFGFFFG